MTTLNEFNSYGEDLERLLLLRTSPIAVKLLEKGEEVPEMRPDFPRPEFYKTLFRMWGLDVED